MRLGRSDTMRTAEANAVLASAAHDLPCPRTNVELVDVFEEDSRSYVAEGCGDRLTYLSRVSLPKQS